jgi:hypothetical protein
MEQETIYMHILCGLFVKNKILNYYIEISRKMTQEELAQLWLSLPKDVLDEFYQGIY